MKRFVILFTALALFLALTTPAGAVDFQEELQRLTQDNARGYIGPFATAFGTAMNSGLYHTAKPHSLLGLDISAKISLLQVADEDLTYDFYFPHVPFPVTNPITSQTDTLAIDLNQFYLDRKTSTVFGDNPAPQLTPDQGGVDAALRSALADAGWSPSDISFFMNTPAWNALRDSLVARIPPFQSVSGIGVDFFGLAMPQVSVGLPMKSEVLLRILPTMAVGDFGDVSFIGVGLKHNVSQYIPVPMFPVDISVQFVYQQLKLGSLIESKHTAFNVEVSKKLGLPVLSLTPYVGVGLESSDLKVEYTIKNSTYPDIYDNATGSLIPDGIGDFEGQTFGFDLEGDNSFRATGGVRLGLGFITVNADYSAGAYTTASVGVGLTFR